MAQAMAVSSRGVRAAVVLPVALLVLGGWVILVVVRDHGSAPSFAAMWLAMSVAMMIPTAFRPMMRAAQGSASGAWRFVAGFVAVWIIAGPATYLVMNAVEWTTAWIAAAWVLAGAYQLTPLMQRNLTTCRSIRFAGRPTGYGMRQGLRCVASCLPLMLAVMVTVMALPGTVLPMVALVGVTALLCWEKQPGLAPRAIAAVGMAMLLVAAGGAVLLGGGGGSIHHSTGTSTS
jgi:predicted metal-binding membrane protein